MSLLRPPSDLHRMKDRRGDGMCGGRVGPRHRVKRTDRPRIGPGQRRDVPQQFAGQALTETSAIVGAEFIDKKFRRQRQLHTAMPHQSPHAGIKEFKLHRHAERIAPANDGEREGSRGLPRGFIRQFQPDVPSERRPDIRDRLIRRQHVQHDPPRLRQSVEQFTVCARARARFMTDATRPRCVLARYSIKSSSVHSAIWKPTPVPMPPRGVQDQVASDSCRLLREARSRHVVIAQDKSWLIAEDVGQVCSTAVVFPAPAGLAKRLTMPQVPAAAQQAARRTWYSSERGLRRRRQSGREA